MVTKIKLLPCPFCGGVPTLTKKQMWQGSHGYYGCYGFSVKCENEDCAITPFTRTFDTIYEKDENKQKKKAIAAWNSRTSDAVPVVRCRDCKYYEEYRTNKNKQIMRYCMRMAKNDMEYHVKPDDYCSYGVKKGEG